MTYALGLMSGTSMDGIDVAVIDTRDQRLIYGATRPYSPEVLKQLKPVMDGQVFDARYFARLEQLVGQAFAEVADLALQQIPMHIREDVHVIGCHGQTICHDTSDSIPYSWQMGSPYPLLKTCRIPVVYDFRRSNMTEGGQGAPLAPLYHKALFYQGEPIAVVNIGGISNISILDEKPLMGYDVGPGNCLMDAWILKHQALSMDKNGEWAATGCCHQALLDSLMQDAFIQKKHPKSIGKEYFSLTRLEENIKISLSKEDVQATLAHMTAQCIAREIKWHLPSQKKVLICGGGAKNTFLMQLISSYLDSYDVQATDAIGISSDYLEAMMIAWLADARLKRQAFDLKPIMGGSNKALLGVICE